VGAGVWPDSGEDTASFAALTPWGIPFRARNPAQPGNGPPSFRQQKIAFGENFCQKFGDNCITLPVPASSQPLFGTAMFVGNFFRNTMTTLTSLKTAALTIGLAVSASLGVAQAPAPGGPPVGLLGQEYTEFSAGMRDVSGRSDHGYDLGLSGNIGVASNLDLGGGFSHNWIRGRTPGHGNAASVSVTTYAEVKTVKPFATLALGYEWTHVNGRSDRTGRWGGAVGAEIRAGEISFTPRVVFLDGFRSTARGARQVTHEIEGNYWLSSRRAFFAGAGYTDVHQSRFDFWHLRLGLRLKR